MTAFASNSLLCRLALKQTAIDPATFTFVRVFSGAIALWLVARMRGISSDKSGNWPSALALFVYAAAFSFAYVGLPAGTGALLLFAAVQATMILWGFHNGERLDLIQVFGLVIALAGLVLLVFPSLSAPPLIGSMLMLSAGVAWGIYSVRGKVADDVIAVTTGNFVRAVLFAAAASLALISHAHVRPSQELGMGLFPAPSRRPRLRHLVQCLVWFEDDKCRDSPVKRAGSCCRWRNSLARRTDHVALRFRFGCSARRNRTRYMGTDSRQTHMI